jgi:hypothetical protein
MSEHYENPSENEVGTLKKLTKAFELAKSAAAATQS